MRRTLLLFTVLAAAAPPAVRPAAASECGLSCCIASGLDGVGSSLGLSASLQYEWMLMETNRQGTDEISPMDIIEAELADRTGRYAVSTRMVMQKVAASVVYRPTEHDAFLLTVPWITNDMDMRMGMKMMAGGPITTTDTTMDTVDGVGDISLLYVRDVYKDVIVRTRKRLSAGVAVKLPTGADDARTPAGNLVHMMMQAGTGATDVLFLLSGSLDYGEHADGGALFLLAPRLTYQLNTRNDRGYKVGDHLNYDVSGRYRLTSKFNVKLDVNGVWAQSDDTDGTLDPDGPVTGGSPPVAYQNPMMNVIDNVDHTGLHSIFLSPGFQWVATRRIVVDAEWRVPAYQDVTGIQQVTDRWLLARASYRF